ncbi:helix-turn-helix domain-containing protein [Buttiauxella sp. WJP83]|uniref:helix-turn-helix domain-containing protein n=1 Tax=Buttiauxella sp. WJP83 TaxID=2986951 RepID=UPI0022DD2F8E|nr:helix-turn-helix domain-containing protein [Buttiauxella sp. WJP83]WBM72574.1 helix-turn-helix domain-containing protein [Buttiauxella sp. WJP83]
MNETDMFPTYLSVPSPFAREIIDKLLPYAILKTYPARRKLMVSSENVHFSYLISHGSFEYHRQNDDLIVGFSKAPAIMGMSNYTEMFLGCYIKTLSTCEIGILPTREALEVIDKLNLWKTLAEHLFVINAKLFTVYQHVSGPTTYALVRAQILELMSETQNIRNSTTIENYISSKINLSRSGIMKILSSLKQGGYIEIERGKLVKMNSLPKEY